MLYLLYVHAIVSYMAMYFTGFNTYRPHAPSKSMEDFQKKDEIILNCF